MAKVGILMGSDSDLPVMKKAADMLEKFGIEYEMKIISAHRMPDTFVDYATKAEDRIEQHTFQADGQHRLLRQ